MFTTIELFAGAGGLALGIEKAGFKTLALNEFNADACATLRKNRPNWNVIEGDVAEISGLDLEEYFSVRKGELDLLSGGAPCQAFSYAGKKLGLEDARGTLFYHYATFLEKLQPKMFLFENVKCFKIGIIQKFQSPDPSADIQVFLLVFFFPTAKNSPELFIIFYRFKCFSFRPNHRKMFL